MFSDVWTRGRALPGYTIAIICTDYHSPGNDWSIFSTPKKPGTIRGCARVHQGCHVITALVYFILFFLQGAQCCTSLFLFWSCPQNNPVQWAQLKEEVTGLGRLHGKMWIWIWVSPIQFQHHNLSDICFLCLSPYWGNSKQFNHPWVTSSHTDSWQCDDHGVLKAKDEQRWFVITFLWKAASLAYIH